MNIRVYLNDWFFNAGMVGFLRILEENNDNFALKKDNYIEFDTENLRKFCLHYFNYFLKKYSVAEKFKNRTKASFEYLENNIEVTFDDANTEKKRKDKIKSSKDSIKKAINEKAEKIKKFDNDTYVELKNQCGNLIKETTRQGIVKIKEVVLSSIGKEEVNKKLTLNKFKKILNESYFGQPSFLNGQNSNLSYEEQQSVMYKDYISEIVELGFIQDVLDNKYNIEELQKYILNAQEDSNISNSIKKIYSKIEKRYINKNKTIESVQEFLKVEFTKKCTLCGSEFGLTSNYSEANFVPLAISSDNARNFFWNQNVKMPICAVCKLMMFCTPAGITKVTKVVKEYKGKGKEKYNEKENLAFVNYDTSIDRLYKTNVNFSNKSKKDNNFKNPYAELILDIVEQDKTISNWQLQNIFFVEFDSDYDGKYSRTNYFNIQRYVATFFVKYSSQTLSCMKDYKYKLQITDSILKNKDIKYIVDERLRGELSNDSPNGYNSFLATRIRMILNLLKKGDGVMEDIKKSDAKLFAVYKMGIEIHEELKRNNAENKISGYSYKLLNSIKAGNKKEFIDTVIRIHMSMGKDVSGIFIEALQSNGLDFESIGHSFLAGLISNKYDKNEEVKSDE